MSSRRPAPIRIAGIALAAIAASVVLSACGDDDDSDSGNTAAATTEAVAGAGTISVQSVGGLDALVDAEGNVLYTNDQDSGNKIACTDECAAIWLPVTAESGQPASDDPGVEAKLGVIDNPDGSRQVTYEGLPLYTFTEDSPGEVTGDGFVDEFAGVTFTWTAATASGAQSGGGAATTETETEPETEPETTEDDSGGGGGYGY